MMQLLRRIKSALRIRLSAFGIFLKAFWWLTWVRLGLKFVPFAQLQAKVDRIAKIPNRSPGYYSLYGLVWAVETATKVMPGGAKCLARAMTTQILMGQNLYPYDFCIGVQKDETGQFKAHAWIESDQQVVIGGLPDLDRYKRLEKRFYQQMANSL